MTVSVSFCSYLLADICIMLHQTWELGREKEEPLLSELMTF